MRQSLPSICIGKKKDMGCPTPAKRKPASNITMKSNGPSTIAARRKSQRLGRDRDAGEAVANAAAGEDERLEGGGFISAATAKIPPPRITL
jgi:hypothetical protein